MAEDSMLPKATLTETIGFFSKVLIPTIAKGPIIRRPKVVALGERMNLNKKAIKYIQDLEEKYVDGPLLLRIPKRKYAIILSPEHVTRILDESPEPFATATMEKRAALAHFEPKNALVSHGSERDERRRFNEQVLESDNPMHRLAESFVAVVNEEASGLITHTDENNGLDWEAFIEVWYKIVRRIVFGDHARDDNEITQMITKLRSDANWAFLKPKRKKLRDKFHEKVKDRLARAEPGSLASVIENIPGTDKALPEQQVPQWLFAFDPACMATYRALALLSTHPDKAEKAHNEIENDETRRQHLPYLRACILESLRLWPTTPLVLRESTKETEWKNGIMPAGTHIVIFAPYFHRDNRKQKYADIFMPEIWLDREKYGNPLIPFSDGPAICPGRHLVLLLTSAMLAALITQRRFQITEPERLDGNGQLPGTFNNYSLDFETSRFQRN